jgi:hypothetical protein
MVVDALLQEVVQRTEACVSKDSAAALLDGKKGN